MSLTILIPWLLFGVATITVAVLVRQRLRLRRNARRNRDRLQASFERQRQLERSQAAAEERDRIYGDLHDDIGAKLLDLVYGATTPEQADLARSVLQDLRDVVTRSRAAPGSLLSVLTDIREEAAERLGRVGAELVWVQPEPIPDPDLDQAQSLHLFRIVREAITNAIRHAHVTSLRIRVRPLNGELLLDVTDNGPGLDAERRVGSGTQTMSERAALLQGSLQWNQGTLGGTQVLLRFPIPEQSVAAPAVADQH